MPTFADIKKKIDEMERAADRLLQVTKELRETVSIPWIKFMKDECHDADGVITKHFDECEKCSEFPCKELCDALNAIINDEN